MTPKDLLISEIDVELHYIRDTIEDAKDFLQKSNSGNPNNIIKASGINLLTQFYNGIESILRRIVRFQGIDSVFGDQFKSELLELFTSKSNDTQLPVLSKELYEILSNYHKLRYVIQQGYHLSLEWDKLTIAIRNMNDSFILFFRFINDYIVFLHKINETKS